MKILMLGWEYPPMISGGLGTATEGLINGLIKMGNEVTLILPYFPHLVKIPGLKIVSPENPFVFEKNEKLEIQENLIIKKTNDSITAVNETYNEIKNSIQEKLNAHKNSHYNYKIENKELSFSEKKKIEYNLKKIHECIINLNENKENQNNRNIDFSFSRDASINEKCYIVGLLALDVLSKDENYQVIHANDWMTFTATQMIRNKYQIPIVAHIHSTEIDRSGEINNNKNILEIEKMGVSICDIVIAVSEYTKNLLVEKFNIPPEKIKVVYNANNYQHVQKLNEKIEPVLENSEEEIKPVVTFVGRITFQKGPSYFVLAAEKVLKENPNVIFKVVGTGDLLPAMKQLTWELGIHKNFQFEGFLNSTGVQLALQTSDLFIMPSVSEPFGIVALEAIAQNIPIIISKQSGVSEVLHHAMKVDFWDIDLMADRILSILKYSPMKKEMITNSIQDLNDRTWLHSAQTLISAYSEIN
ncbi:glycosyltransferase [Silvanigrella paludirubra]|uniref:Glycosyltransferase n=1 Tax=Silvanigrella paludirubra TaxID=2499159 RepID=A0A6N6VV95_9BACT|nr:glycosyltransferase [Silvanigrella paludirubra]KAB8040500.1 glycosyltransferase [Silvanigrella paludirubra]